MALATLSIDVVARLAKMEADMGKAARIAEKNAQRIEKAFSGVSNAIKAGVAGISIGLLFNKFVDETVQAQREQAQLAAVLRSTGEAAGFSADQLNLMAERLSNASVFSEGDINNAQTRLLSYTNIVGEKFPEAMQVVIDMADRMGMSLEQSAETIGRALDVPSQGLSSLTKQGFRFSEEQKKLVENLERAGRVAEAQSIVLDALKSSYGGAAQATRDTFGGSIAALKNQLDDLMTGDDGSLEGAREAIEDLTSALDSPEVKRAFASMTSGLASLIQMTVGASAGFINLSTDILDWAKKTIGGAFDKRELAGVAGEVIRLKNELDLLNDLVVRDNTNAAVPHWKKRIEEVSAQLEVAKQKFREADRAFQMAQGPDPAAFAKMDFVPSMLPAVRVVGAIGGDDKRKTADPNIGPRTFAEIYGEDIAKLFDDNVITRAAKFQVRIEELDDLFFRGIVSAEEYDAAMAELAQSTSTADKTFSQFLEDQKRLDELIKAGPAATLERQRKDMELLTQAYLEGRFGILGTTEAIKAYGDIVNHTLGNTGKLKEELDAMSVFAEQAGRNIQDALGDTLSRTLKGDFDSIGEMWGNLLIDMAAQAMAVQLNQFLFGDFDKKSGNWSGVLGPVLSSFGGLFADGGTLGAGKWGIAGEAGPEIVRGPAQIVPMGRGAGAPVINLTYNIAPDMGRGEVLRALQMTREQTKADILESMRRAGVFS